MKNWKKYLLVLFIVFSLFLISGSTAPKYSNQRVAIRVTSPRLPTISSELPKFTEKFTELKTEILVDSPIDASKTLSVGNNFRASYRGWLAETGELFDQNISTDGISNVIEFNPKSLIQGFSQGVVGMKIGEVRRIFIPAALGYGEAGTQGIPPNSDIVFDVELMSF